MSSLYIGTFKILILLTFLLMTADVDTKVTHFFNISNTLENIYESLSHILNGMV